MTADRLQRWAIFLMGYNYTIKYRPTAQHANADALSRLPEGVDNSFDTSEEACMEVDMELSNCLEAFPVNSKQIAQATLQDGNLKQVLKFIKKGWPDKLTENQQYLRPFFDRRLSLGCRDNVILLQTEHTRVVIPGSLQPKVLDMLHRGHWGIVRTKQLARRYCWWPMIDKAISERISSCKSCQFNGTAPRRDFCSWPTPEFPWDRIHVDLAGPYLKSNWLICVDAYSKFPFVVELQSTTSATVIKALQNIFSIEGLPTTIVSDNGTQFTATEFQKFCLANGIKHMTTAPFHPASNGEAERFVRTFKNALAKILHENTDKHSALLQYLSTYRMTPDPTSGKSPSELLHGRQARNILSLMQPRRISRYAQHKAQQHKNRKPFITGQLVYARNFAKGDKWVEAIVRKRYGKMMYLIKTKFTTWRRHYNQLKPRSSNKNTVPDDGHLTMAVPTSNPNLTMAVPTSNPNPHDVTSNSSPSVPQNQPNNTTETQNQEDQLNPNRLPTSDELTHEEATANNSRSSDRRSPVNANATSLWSSQPADTLRRSERLRKKAVRFMSTE